MGAVALKALCGKNLGYFPREHDSPENSDGEEEQEVDPEADQFLPKGYREHFRQNNVNVLTTFMKKVPGGGLAGESSRGWGPYLVRIQVDSNHAAMGIRATKARVTQQMLDKLPTMGTIHTLSLTHCHLKDFPPVMSIEGLEVIEVSHNHLKRIGNSALGSISRKADSVLDKLICSFNQIESITPGVLCKDYVARVTVMNLSHNLLTFLPRDFGVGANELKYLDIGFNKLTALPDGIANCRKLQLLYLQHNALTQLPDYIGEFKDLRKLFVSYNQLKTIPDEIGECNKLEKVRLACNSIRYLPPSFLNLWNHPDPPHRRNGCLEELMLDRNPLVQPSITAFEMGGLNQAFKLFAEWVNESGEQNAGEAQLALDNGAGLAALGDLDADEGVVADEGPGASKPGLMRCLTRQASGFSLEQVDADFSSQHQDPVEIGQEARYYFPQDMRPEKITEIRQAESYLLLRKKTMYIDKMVRDAHAMRRKANKMGKSLPPELEQFLSPDFCSAHFTGKIPVTDLDLYFNLMVYSVKPLFATCQALFEKFQNSNETAMNKEMAMLDSEWVTLCSRAPVRLPNDVRDQMFDLLAGQEGCIALSNFVAGFHIHDIEEQDAFIRRVAQVQRLDYYDMDVEEMRERLKARAAAEAALKLSFDDGGNGENEGKSKRLPPVHLDPVEGERVLASERAQRVEIAADAGHGSRGHKISMTNAQFVEREAAAGDGSAGDDDDGGGAESDDYSRAEDSELDPFDAVAILREAREMQEAERREMERHSRRVSIVDKGIEEKPASARKSVRQNPDAENGQEPQGRRKKKASGPSGGKTKDPRFRTDVFEVRLALREAFRNLPMEDFRKLVNFMVRGMKRIIELDDDTGATYWHVDDPSFRSATGIRSMHSYAKQLFIAMGFVPVMNTYWVWPQEHLRDADKGHDWGHDAIDAECPGSSPVRLQDMVKLLQVCQKDMAKRGSQFKGHFL